MTDAQRIQARDDKIQELREKVNSLNDEITSLKEEVDKRDSTIAELKEKNETLTEKWEQRLADLSEAIEKAAEAEMSYNDAREKIVALQKKNQSEVERLIKMLKKTVKGKAV